MTPEEHTAATAEQPAIYPSELAWVTDKAACKAAFDYLTKQFRDNPSAFNWVELEQTMARYQNVVINIRWEEE